MKPRIILTLICSWLFISSYSQICFTCDDAPDGTIFCDDFESTDTLSARYMEWDTHDGDFVPLDGVGRDGSRGMRALWHAYGSSSAGWLHKTFGRNPTNYQGKNAPNPTEDYTEIYWRIDLRNQPGWQGGGADNLTKIFCFGSATTWAQAYVGDIRSAGVGGGDDNYLEMDPYTGIDENGELATTKYNNYDNMTALGRKEGNIDLFSTKNSGKWYCIEAHLKLNTIGYSDGIFEFWINDTLQAGTYDLNWVRDWSEYGINAIYVENYWKLGSPVTQERYLDNLVISTERIGCSTCDPNTSVSEIDILNMVSVYPNPTSNYLNVKVEREIAMDGYKLEINNTNGKSVLKTDQIKNIDFSYDLSEYSSGIYFYRVISNSHDIKTGKLIVNAY